MILHKKKFRNSLDFLKKSDKKNNILSQKFKNFWNQFEENKFPQTKGYLGQYKNNIRDKKYSISIEEEKGFNYRK